MNRTKRIVAAILAIAMCAVLFAGCGTKTESAKTGVEDGVLTVAMECAYAPYNWTQSDDSNGAVPIKDSSDYANGYDIMMAKKICEANGWKLEVVRLDWDSLVPAVQTGKVDAVIAGSVDDRRAYAAGRFRRSLPLCEHRLHDKAEQQVCKRYLPC